MSTSRSSLSSRVRQRYASDIQPQGLMFTRSHSGRCSFTHSFTCQGLFFYLGTVQLACFTAGWAPLTSACFMVGWAPRPELPLPSLHSAWPQEWRAPPHTAAPTAAPAGCAQACPQGQALHQRPGGGQLQSGLLPPPTRPGSCESQRAQIQDGHVLLIHGADTGHVSACSRWLPLQPGSLPSPRRQCSLHALHRPVLALGHRRTRSSLDHSGEVAATWPAASPCPLCGNENSRQGGIGRLHQEAPPSQPTTLSVKPWPCHASRLVSH